MLEFIRERCQGFITWIIVIAISLSFALFGASSFLQHRVESRKMASINKHDVTEHEFKTAFERKRRRLENEYRGSTLSVKTIDNLKKATLDEIILHHALLDPGTRLQSRY